MTPPTGQNEKNITQVRNKVKSYFKVRTEKITHQYSEINFLLMKNNINNLYKHLLWFVFRIYTTNKEQTASLYLNLAAPPQSEANSVMTRK